MIHGYINWFYTFVRDMISWLDSAFITEGVSLLGFFIAIALLCVVIGGLVFR